MRGAMALGATGNPPSGLKTRMRNPAHVPELEKNSSARLMHRLGDLLPAGDLFIGVDAGRIGTTRALLGNRRGFVDDQSRRRALRIILRHQRRRHAARSRAHSRERSHDDAVWRFNRAQPDRSKEIGSIHNFAMKRLLAFGRREQWGEHPIAMALQRPKMPSALKLKTKVKEPIL